MNIITEAAGWSMNIDSKYEYWIAGAKRLRKYTSSLGIILLLPVIPKPPSSFLLLTVQERVSPFFLIFHLCMGEPESCYWVATCVSMTLNCLTPLPTNLYCKLGCYACPSLAGQKFQGKPHSPDFCGGHRNVGSTNQIGEFTFRIGHMISTYLNENKSVQPTRLGSPHETRLTPQCSTIC